MPWETLGVFPSLIASCSPKPYLSLKCRCGWFHLKRSKDSYVHRKKPTKICENVWCVPINAHLITAYSQRTLQTWLRALPLQSFTDEVPFFSPPSSQLVIIQTCISLFLGDGSGSVCLAISRMCESEPQTPTLRRQRWAGNTPALFSGLHRSTH